MAEKPVDPKDAFKAALEAKKAKASGGASTNPQSGAKKAAKSGPDAARRMFQRRSGAS